MQIEKEYRYIEVTGSTNDDCARLLKEGADHPVVVVAGQQHGGKGRRGRTWDSPPGEAVYMSIGLRPEFSPDKASMLTLVAALAVACAIEKITGEKDARIKWPNDIVIGTKKVCGILTEMHLTGEKAPIVVIGVGINANNHGFPQELSETATSLYQVYGRTIELHKLVEEVLVQFERYYNKFEEKCDMSTIMGEYVEKMINKDKEVRVLDPCGEYTATARGINEKGELLVEKEDGTREAVYAGEVSVRGIYGYV